MRGVRWKLAMQVMVSKYGIKLPLSRRRASPRPANERRAIAMLPPSAWIEDSLKTTLCQSSRRRFTIILSALSARHSILATTLADIVAQSSYSPPTQTANTCFLTTNRQLHNNGTTTPPPPQPHPPLRQDTPDHPAPGQDNISLRHQQTLQPRRQTRIHRTQISRAQAEDSKTEQNVERISEPVLYVVCVC